MMSILIRRGIRLSVARCLPVLAMSGLVLAQVAAHETVSSEAAAWRQAIESVSADQLQRHVDVLADDTFEGREAGSRGGQAAGGYLVQQLQQLGLKPAGSDGGYFQPFGNGYRNVLAIWPGSDPQLQQELILVGAHYDHVGYGARRNSYGPLGYIHNGADDNASGAAAILEIAEALTLLPEPPKRSILLVWWDGEEKGLLGSKHWLARPTVNRDHLRLAVNLDMVGRLRDQRVEVYGTRTGPGLRRRTATLNQPYNLEFDYVWDLPANSDHHPFFEQGIPVLMFHTRLHDDYHRPSDDAHKVNAEGMQLVTRWTLETIGHLANADDLPTFREASRRESNLVRTLMEKPAPPARPRLGVSWRTELADDVSDQDGENPAASLLLTRVRSGSPAERAGLRVGDRLLRIDESPIRSSEAFQRDVLRAHNPVSLSIRRGDEEEPQVVEVQLDGAPVRLGIAFREDPAEPGVLLVTRVTPGSSAAFGGLEVGDRIYELDQRPLANGDGFLNQIAELPWPIEVTIERRGRLLPLSLPE